ncbi:MAG: PAS domain-containing protein, partial [Calditrichia bacterium]
MASKLEKQKQIFSFLNSKFNNLLEDVNLPVEEAAAEGAQSGTEIDKDRLLSKVYHFYRSIIQNINGGLITLDMDGEVTFSNRTAASLLG